MPPPPCQIGLKAGLYCMCSSASKFYLKKKLKTIDLDLYCITHVIRFNTSTSVVNDGESQKIEITLLHWMKTLLLASTQGDIA